METELGVVINAETTLLLLIYLPVLSWAIYRAPWQSASSKPIQHIWPILCACTFLIWQMDISLMDNTVHIHLIGATLLTVLFGWQFAVIGLSSVLLATCVLQKLSILVFSMASFSLIVVPIFASYWIVRLVYRYLPRHFFVFIFLSGFANAAVAIFCSGITNSVLLDVLSNLDSMQIWQHTLPASLLLVFPEAFITGAVLTIFVVYRPEWVRSFHDEQYLNK